MKRPRYPSDDARLRQRPHVKVHLSWPTHPKYAAAYADARVRGIVLGVWMIAARAHASATGDRVTMRMSQIMEATGCDNAPTALRLLRDTAATMGWPMESRSTRGGVEVVVEVRNFGRKQGFHSANGGVPPRSPDPSEFRRTEEQNSGGAPRSPAEPKTGPGGGTFVPQEPEKPRAQSRTKRPQPGSRELPQMPHEQRGGNLEKLGDAESILQLAGVRRVR